MDLRTNYLGLQLAHPIIASASPLTSTVEGIRALEADCQKLREQAAAALAAADAARAER